MKMGVILLMVALTALCLSGCIRTAGKAFDFGPADHTIYNLFDNVDIANEDLDVNMVFSQENYASTIVSMSEFAGQYGFPLFVEQNQPEADPSYGNRIYLSSYDSGTGYSNPHADNMMESQWPTSQADSAIVKVFDSYMGSDAINIVIAYETEAALTHALGVMEIDTDAAQNIQLDDRFKETCVSVTYSPGDQLDSIIMPCQLIFECNDGIDNDLDGPIDRISALYDPFLGPDLGCVPGPPFYSLDEDNSEEDCANWFIDENGNNIGDPAEPTYPGCMPNCPPSGELDLFSDGALDVYDVLEFLNRIETGATSPITDNYDNFGTVDVYDLLFVFNRFLLCG